MSRLTSLRKAYAIRGVKPTLASAVIILTVVLFIQFFGQHPAYLHQLGGISPWAIVWVLLLNALMVGVLVGITFVTLHMCGKRLGWQENFLLTSYSSIANFFGPLQSGPGVRAIYLKTRHAVRLRDYTLVSLISLGLFAFFSAFFLLVGTRPWWQTASALIAVAAASAMVLRWFKKRDKKPQESSLRFSSVAVAALISLALVQVLVTIGWYYVELKAVDPRIHFSQAMSYAGAANFALFVSITPDAVGIREAFLVFSRHIHHVPTGDIVSANVIDRGVYVLFLGLLFLLVLSMHARERLHLKVTAANKPL